MFKKTFYTLLIGASLTALSLTGCGSDKTPEAKSGKCGGEKKCGSGKCGTGKDTKEHCEDQI